MGEVQGRERERERERGRGGLWSRKERALSGRKDGTDLDAPSLSFVALPHAVVHVTIRHNLDALTMHTPVLPSTPVPIAVHPVVKAEAAPLVFFVVALRKAR